MIDPAQMETMAGALQPALGGPPTMAAPPPAMPPGLGPQGGPTEPPKKPPLLLPPTLATKLARAYVDQARSMARMVADQTGPPDDFKRFPLKQQVRAWYKRDIRQDPYALKEQGLSAVEIRDKVYPLRRILLKMAGPRPEDRARYAARMKAERARLAMVEGESSA